MLDVFVQHSVIGMNIRTDMQNENSKEYNYNMTTISIKPSGDDRN